MANLAIKGHSKRGKEVIEILKMLGGCNSKYSGYDTDFCYYIDKFNNIECYDKSKFEKYIVLTLEEFLEKYPYKIGDEVINDEGDIVKIFNMRWSERVDEIYYSVILHDDIFEYPADLLQPYKEKTMEDKGTLVEINLTRETPKAEEIEVILGDYEFVLKDGKTYFVKKKPIYPKTYEECCDVLSIPPYYKLKYWTYEHGYNEYTTLNKLCSLQDKLNTFSKLLICRDAYWKIAGEQMGLGKPWEPDYKNPDIDLYVIINIYNQVEKAKYGYGFQQCVLTFPTEEMRDVFFENFKELIETCKELL